MEKQKSENKFLNGGAVETRKLVKVKWQNVLQMSSGLLEESKENVSFVKKNGRHFCYVTFCVTHHRQWGTKQTKARVFTSQTELGRHVCCHGNRQPFKNNTQQLLKMRENNYFSNIYINGQPCLLGILFIYLFLSFFNGENVCDWVCECLRARNVTFNCFFLSLTCPDGSRDLIPLSPLVGFYTESLRRNFVYYLLCGVSAPRIGTGTTGGGHLDFQYGRAHRHRKHHVACIHSLHIFEKT